MSVAIALGLLVLVQAPTPPPADSIAVVGFRAKAGVETSTAELLTDRLTARLKGDGFFLRVVGSDELRATLNLQQQQQLLDCDGTQCMAEVAGALNVRWLAVGSVGQLGRQWLLTFKVVDTRTAEAAYVVSHNAPGDESVMLRLTDQSVGEVLAQMRGQNGPPPSADPVAQPAAVNPTPTTDPVAALQPPHTTDGPQNADPAMADDVVASSLEQPLLPHGWPTYAALGTAALALGLGVSGIVTLWAHVAAPLVLPSAAAENVFVVGLFASLLLVLPAGLLLVAASGVAAGVAVGLYAVRLVTRRQGGPLWWRPAPLLGLLAGAVAGAGAITLVATVVSASVLGVTGDNTRVGPYILSDVFVAGLLGGGLTFLILNVMFVVSVGAMAAALAVDGLGFPLFGTAD